MDQNSALGLFILWDEHYNTIKSLKKDFASYRGLFKKKLHAIDVSRKVKLLFYTKMYASCFSV